LAQQPIDRIGIGNIEAISGRPFKMATTSSIDEFAAGIGARASAHVTACLGMLLTIAILFRQSDLIGAECLTLLEETLALIATLPITSVAAWCAGYLAIASTKNSPMRSNETKRRHDVPRSEDHKLIKDAENALGPVSERHLTANPKRQSAPSIQGGLDGITMPLQMLELPR
jgi:hypothetical protein